MPDRNPSVFLSRRSVVLQLAAVGATACALPKPGEPAESSWGPVAGAGNDTGTGQDDSPSPTDSGDTGAALDTAPKTDTSTSPVDTAGDVDTGGGADTAVESEHCAVDESLPKTCEGTAYAGEGPNYLDNPPERSNLNVTGEAGTRLVVSGRVMSPDCVPFKNARVDIWHAAQDTAYDWDKKMFHCRGYVRTGADGSYCFETLHPPNIPRPDDVDNAQHLHVKIWVDDAVVLITQIYFAGDSILKKVPVVPTLIYTVEEVEDGLETLTVDFVVDPDNPQVGVEHG